MKRRQFLSLAGKAAAATAAGAVVSRTLPGAAVSAGEAPPDYKLRIAPLDLELAPDVKMRTIAYNGQVPGPLLRLKEGVPVKIEVSNETETPELVHWHGLAIDPINDGAMEEGSPMLAPKGKLTYQFSPRPAGSRWYHTHTTAANDLKVATYTGQFGFLYVEPAQDAGGYDQEIFLAVHHWGPSWFQMGAPMNALDVKYQYASFNDKLMSAAEPIRVRRGQRVLFRFLNASATETVTLHLPGHRFTVIALDGNPVPQPRNVSTLSLGVAERVDAIVEMRSPGKWVLSSTDARERQMGLGRVVEYAGSNGDAVWLEPGPSDWDYLAFANGGLPLAPAQELPMVFAPLPAGKDGLQRWTVNGKSYPDTPPIRIQKGSRYRLVFVNSSGEAHPLHLHRHSFEVVSIAGKACSGLLKDTVMIAPYSSMKVEFTANNPGKTLFHCHQQLHMDYGFMQLFEYV
jgi:FtsP/CotA-like multicopper oxidase with cupredoxin domain